MLHSESRQSSSQGYRTLAIAAGITIAINISACQGKSAQQTAADEVAQKLEQFYRASFADRLEQACVKTIEDGVMTGDLYLLSKLENKRKVSTRTFLEEIRARM